MPNEQQEAVLYNGTIFAVDADEKEAFEQEIVAKDFKPKSKSLQVGLNRPFQADDLDDLNTNTNPAT